MPNTHARCFVCKKPGPKHVVITGFARTSAFIDCNVLIPAGSRCCPSHFNSNNKLDETCLKAMKTTDSSFVSRSTILEMLQSLREMCISSHVAISFETFNDSDYSTLTGMDKASFDDVYSLLKDSIRRSSVRSARTTLGLFLFKLKSGLSNKLLSTLFSISLSSLRRGLSSVRKCFMDEFVPRHLGFGHVTRDDIICKHTTPIAQRMFGMQEDGDHPKMILVLDGTYIYVQKSNNFLFQRRTYSMQKGRPLVKPMVFVTSSGYFVSIIGPYLADAKNSDAQILNHILQHNIEQIKSFITKDDIFIVDRGFRDSLDLLKDLGIHAEMPAFMTKSQRQMSTSDANSSRLVTKVRVSCCVLFSIIIVSGTQALARRQY